MRKTIWCALVIAGLAAVLPSIRAQFDDLDGSKGGKGAPKDGGIKADFLFDYKEYRAKGLPGYCNCYVVLRSAQKPRPLFVTGVGREGAISMRFDNDDGMSEKASLSLRGSGSCIFGGYNVSGASDGPTFAGYDWFRLSPTPEIIVTVKELKGLKVQRNEALNVLLKKNRDDRTRIDPVLCDAKADIIVSVKGKSTECRDVPTEVILNEARRGAHWALWIRTTVKFNGADLGFTGGDAGAVTLKIVMAGFAQTPKGFGSAPAKLDEIMNKPPSGGDMFDL